MPALAAHPSAMLFDVLPNRSRRNDLAGLSELCFTYKGRGALFQFFSTLQRDSQSTVLLPAFHCPTVVDPIIAAGFRIRFYATGDEFSPDLDDLAQKVDEHTVAVVVINYFGFMSPLEGLLELKKEFSFLVVEDCSHSFLLNKPLRLGGGRGDVSTFSFWKLLPSLVGGGIRYNNKQLNLPTAAKPVPLKQLARHSWTIFDQCMHNLEPGFCKSLYLKQEALRVGNNSTSSSPKGPVKRQAPHLAYPYDQAIADMAIPGLAKYMLMNTDYDTVAKKRRENYQIISNELRDFVPLTPMFQTLDDDIVPWAYPVLLKNRDAIDYKLREQGVPLFTFGEVLHDELKQEPVLYSKTQEIADSALALPVHQQLSNSDIYKYCEIINTFFNN